MPRICVLTYYLPNSNKFDKKSEKILISKFMHLVEKVLLKRYYEVKMQLNSYVFILKSIFYLIFYVKTNISVYTSFPGLL